MTHFLHCFKQFKKLLKTVFLEEARSFAGLFFSVRSYRQVRRARKIVVTRVKEDTGKSQLWRGHCRAHVHTRPTDRLEYSSGSNCRFQIRPGGKDGWNESTAGCRYKRVFSMFCYGGKAVVAVNQVAPPRGAVSKKERNSGMLLKPQTGSIFAFSVRNGS